MTRRVCETCRHFQAAGFDSMGWCTHPRRRLGSDVRILARALELQCRDDWSRDLWQSAESTPGVNPGDLPAGPVSPATHDELRFIALTANRQRPDGPPADPAAGGEDVVVGEVTSLFPGSDASSREERLRESLRRAHEALRARKRESRVTISPLNGSDDPAPTELTMQSGVEPRTASQIADGEVVVNNQDGSRPRPIIGEVSPVELGEMGRPFPKLTSFPDDDARFSSIPEAVDGFDLPLAVKRDPKPTVRRAGFDDVDRELGAWPVAADSTPLAEPAVRVSWQPAVERSPEQRPNRDAFERGVSIQPTRRVPEPRVFMPDLPDIDDTFEQHEPAPERPRRVRERDVATRRERLPRASEPAGAVVDQRPVDDEIVDERVTAGYVADHASGNLETLAEPETWARTPRMCRTCRDFRPAENGERGWCTNKWAFNHRRMVDAGELPCETTIGGWWLPHDDLWLSAIDVSAHSQPTPLLDHWLAQRAAANGEFDTAAPIRRRQRS